MSFDLTLYTTKKLELSESVRRDFGLKNIGQELVLEKEDWQLTISPAEECTSNYLPKQLKRLKRGIKFSYLLIIEPYGYPDEANDIIEFLLEFLTREFDGVIRDHQGNSYYDFDNIAEHIIEENSFIETVCLAWYFNDVEKLIGANFSKLLDILEEFLPDALPSKYSNYSFEYQYYKKSGRSNFEAFVQKNVTSKGVKLHWIPQNSMIHIDLPDRPDELKVFWSWTLKINIPIAEFEKPGHNENALLCWKEIIKLLDPFYSEVRTITELKYVEGITSRMIGRESPPNPNPVFGGFWNGVPKRLGTAVSINTTLAKYWPKSSQLLKLLNENQYYLHFEKLDSGDSLNKLLGKPPRKIRQRQRRGPRVIPQ